ncbi:low molecular weight phosphatase family protein [Arthrobacter sp. ISL-72]|uniref:arsenate-mycothiol transferase ArsC n=1 Tax=Arthrobacter sp. ISL-72 TaxID=2819114 RepID=UPI001BE9E436|nr:low molecular weight phosphatase family protein [Arthrobacter sp. ISL-72]MBT2596427.1 low molecular weight phosphatase family protein [Arthrobacter sp. ISL-72]
MTGGSVGKQVILFLCEHNAGRSQLASALMAHRTNDRFEVRSAGTDPSEQVSEAVAASLGELGIDISGRIPRRVTEADLREADLVVTMKPGLRLPATPAGRLVGWSFPDPLGWDIDGVRPLRDQIDAAVQELASQL